MTDREKKQMEILEKTMLQSENDALTPRGKEKLNHALSELSKLDAMPKEVEDLLEACKKFVSWFDYVSAYQHECLAKGLKEAEENWGSMNEPSPDVNIMKEAIKNLQAVKPKEEVRGKEIYG